MDEKALEILFANVRTLEEAYHLDDELRLIQQMSFTVGENNGQEQIQRALDESKLSVRIKDLVNHKTYDSILELENKGYLNAEKPDQLRLFFERAHKEIIKTPRLQLQMAVDVNEQILNAVALWVSKEIKKKVFLDIITKPQLLAGCVIVYEGVFKDMSLRAMFETKAVEIFKPILSDITERQGLAGS